jgi:phosphoribosylanthranilate isomerase
MAYPPPGPFLLAGGLDAENLQARVAALPVAAHAAFAGVDAASRLEAALGVKDPARVAAFLRAARTLELP